jgi:hypothetical protein
MSATSNSSSGIFFKGFSNQNTGHVSADSIKKMPESMFKSPLAPAYRRNAVVVSSDAAQPVSSSQSRATTVCERLHYYLELHFSFRCSYIASI